MIVDLVHVQTRDGIRLDGTWRKPPWRKPRSSGWMW